MLPRCTALAAISSPSNACLTWSGSRSVRRRALCHHMALASAQLCSLAKLPVGLRIVRVEAGVEMAGVLPRTSRREAGPDPPGRGRGPRHPVPMPDDGSRGRSGGGAHLPRLHVEKPARFSRSELASERITGSRRDFTNPAHSSEAMTRHRAWRRSRRCSPSTSAEDGRNSPETGITQAAEHPPSTRYREAPPHRPSRKRRRTAHTSAACGSARAPDGAPSPTGRARRERQRSRPAKTREERRH